jgi:hypothetical protein
MKPSLFLALSASALLLTPLSLGHTQQNTASKPPKAAASTPLLLAQNQKTAYIIVVGSEATPAERTAARELSEYSQKITGATFAIKAEKDVQTGAPQILIGRGARVKKLLPKQDWAALGTDGIVIKTVGSTLILSGGQPRGTLYAVYTFLEEKLGVRWWTAEATLIPKKRELRIAPQNVTYVPQLQVREIYNDSVQNDPLFATRLKNNGHFQKQGPELGGHNWILGLTHTFQTLLPVEKYFKEHPEWYSDGANKGLPCTADSPIPAAHSWQPSLTNEALRREVVKNALEWIRQNPTATTVAIAQNDNQNRFTGPDDMELEAREGSPSGPLIHFVNAVAAEIEKEFPNILVETLAYQYTQKPPRFVKPRKNVIVRLCSIEADFARPLNSDANATFRDDLKGWKELTSQVAIWDYVTNFQFSMLPHPNIQVLGPNIRFFAANNTTGLFEQGDAFTNATGDFVAMRLWMMSHLMWNPSLNQDDLQQEFLSNYYGAAAPHLKAYLDTIREGFLKINKSLSTMQSDHSYLTLDVMTEATRHFHEALEAVAGNATLTNRVRREKLALDHAWLLRYSSLKREASIREVAFTGPADPMAAVDEFIRMAQEFKVPQYREAAPFADYIPILKARFGPVAPLPEFARDKSAKDVIDSEENQFRLHEPGTVTKILDDPQAPNGRAVQMPGNINEWAVQYVVDENDSFLTPGPWRCYIIARIQAKEGAVAGDALTYGLYNPRTKGEDFKSAKTLAETGSGEYRVLDIGAHQLTSGHILWIAPPKRDDIESVTIDRIVLVREPAKR